MKPLKRFHSPARANTPLKRGVNEIRQTVRHGLAGPSGARSAMSARAHGIEGTLGLSGPRSFGCMLAASILGVPAAGSHFLTL